MQESSWVAIIVGVLTVAGTLFGFGVSNWFESKREERQDIRNRERQWRDRQLESIAELQVALLESMQGTWTASLAWENAKLTTEIASAAGVLPKLPDITKEQWHQNWLAAIRRVAVMATRVQNAELKQLAGEFNTIASKIGSLENVDAIKQELKVLESKVAEANELAGRLFSEFDVPQSEVERNVPSRQRWNCTRVGVVRSSDGGEPTERWRCNRL